MPRPSFHKLILPSTIQAKQLKIPEDFVRRFRDELSVLATVTVPDGNIWSIGLKMADNKCWFHHGWQEFTEHYSLRVGYLLVFRYNGSSAFSVYIFNLNTSEINYESNAFPNSEHTFGNHCQIFEEMEDEDSVETLGLSPPDSLKSKLFGEHEDQRTPGKSSNPHLRLFNGSSFKNCMSWPGSGGNLHAENQSTRDIGVQFSVTDLKKPIKVELPMSEDGKKPSKAGRKKQRVDPNEHTSSIKNEEAELRYRFYESASARKRTVTAEERERAINTAKIFEPPNPFCRVVLRPSYLYRGCIMYLPSCFAEKNLCGVSGFIKLQISDGRQWPVRCLYKGGRAKFSQGWYEFCLENKLGEGDVCVFELLTIRDVVLKVTMFRVLEDVEPRNQPFPQMVSQNRLIRN